MTHREYQQRKQEVERYKALWEQEGLLKDTTEKVLEALAEGEPASLCTITGLNLRRTEAGKEVGTTIIIPLGGLTMIPAKVVLEHVKKHLMAKAQAVNEELAKLGVVNAVSAAVQDSAKTALEVAREQEVQETPEPLGFMWAHYLNEGATLVIESGSHRVSIDITEEIEEGCAAVFRAVNRQKTAEGGISAPLPRYQCHKVVGALKIAEVNLHAHPDPDFDSEEFIASEAFKGGHLFFEEPLWSPCQITAEWYRKHRPEKGGYYVVYEDGYTSFSPAAAFEKGYTRVPMEGYLVRNG